MGDGGKVIGIDLGTTNSLVAVLEGGVPKVLSNVLGERLTPSAVSISDDGTVLVGAAARARMATHPTRSSGAFKRDMGTDRKLQLADRSLSPVELSALVLGALKRDAEEALGHPVHEAVITVPAYFGDLQRQATRHAGELAGLKVERIINEPTAAALAYGLHQRTVEQKVAVLDLGGGTFDVTLLEIIEGVIEIQSSAGDARLGGEDFDDALASHFATRIAAQHGVDPATDPLARARLKVAAETARCALSERPGARVVLPGLAIGKRVISLEETIERAVAEPLWQTLLTRMRQPIERALSDASWKAAQVDAVLLVGGATRMPCVVELARQLFGRQPLQSLPPDEAIAMGAAVQAALKSGDAAVEDLVVTDVAPFSLGIASVTRHGMQMVDDVFAPILERGTTIPASRVESFSTVSDFQKELRVQVFQGEHPRCSLNQKLGEYVLGALPASPAGLQIDIRFTYDINGILEVEMELPGAARKESFVIEKRAGALTPAQLAEARAQLGRLKLHPRDALPNTTALARAEQLYADLVGDTRRLLAERITAFRAVLESQRPEQIASMRAELVALTRTLKTGPR